MIEWKDWRLTWDGAPAAMQFDNGSVWLDIVGDMPEGYDWELLLQEPEGSCAPPVPVWYLWPPWSPASCEFSFKSTCATTLPPESFTSRLPQSSTPRKSEQVP